jgi:hypothetical protein
MHLGVPALYRLSNHSAARTKMAHQSIGVGVAVINVVVRDPHVRKLLEPRVRKQLRACYQLAVHKRGLKAPIGHPMRTNLYTRTEK